MRFTPEEVEFIRTELKIPVSQTENDETTLEKIWEAASDIEVEESNRLETLTHRGKMAVNLVTKLGEA